MSGANTNHNSDLPVENIDASEVPIFGEAQLPDKAFIPMIVENTSPNTGISILALHHLPMDRLTTGGQFQSNRYSLARNGASIDIPSKQVVPAYVSVQAPNSIELAKGDASSTKARFVVISADESNESNYVIQASGLYSFPTNHTYIVGAQYYLSDNVAGETITVAPTVDPQKVFYVIDQKTILINIEG